VDARHKAGHDEFRGKVLPQARDPRKDQESGRQTKGRQRDATAPDNQFEESSGHSGAMRSIEPGSPDAQLRIWGLVLRTIPE
jgi:hypothetical protein